MAAVRPAQPVPRITVSRTEFSIASIRFMLFDMVSGLFRCRLLLGNALCARRRGVQPGNVRAEGGAQPQRGAILRHDFRSLVKNRIIRALVGLRTAGQHGGALVQALNSYPR